MVEPQDAFRALPAAARRGVHVDLVQRAVSAWEHYCAANPRLDYVDSVVGLKHSVDVALPRDALDAATSGRRSPDVEARYGEPLAALQDDDLELPDPVEFAFYAAYNCYRRHAQEADIDDWLIVDQALAALPEPEQRPALTRALAAAGE